MGPKERTVIFALTVSADQSRGIRMLSKPLAGT